MKKYVIPLLILIFSCCFSLAAFAYVNPVFSLPGGSYEGASVLSLSLPDNADKDTKIYYTLNGDEPTTASSEYVSPLTVLKEGDSCVVRAACYSPDGELLGRIKTHTYFKARKRTARVVCLTTDNKNLYDKEIGILENPDKSGKDWERPVHVEIYNASGTLLLAQNAGIRVFGGSSRIHDMVSFRLIARKDGYYDETKYNGSKNFKSNLLNRPYMAGKDKGEMQDKFARLVLRNGGNDSLGGLNCDPQNVNFLRDSTANNFLSLVAPKVAAQYSVFVTVYLNGKYYGVLDMKDDIGDDYFADTYDLAEKDDVVIIKSELDTTRKCDEHKHGGYCRYCGVWFYYEVDNGEDSDLEDWSKLCTTALSASDADYDAAFSALSEKMDIDSFMQYMAFNLYLANTDWPHNNVRLWRYKGAAQPGNEYSDGKWRFAARDMDFCFGRYEAKHSSDLYSLADTDTFRYVLSNYVPELSMKGAYPDSLYLQGLLDFCLKNDGFRNRFIAYCKSLASPRSRMRLANVFTAGMTQLQNEVPQMVDFYQPKNYTMAIWQTAAHASLDFIHTRNRYFLEDLEAAMGYYE